MQDLLKCFEAEIRQDGVYIEGKYSYFIKTVCTVGIKVKRA
jgi:hypothetical protein